MRSKFRLFLTAIVAVACIIALSSPGVAGASTIGSVYNAGPTDGTEDIPTNGTEDTTTNGPEVEPTNQPATDGTEDTTTDGTEVPPTTQPECASCGDKPVWDPNAEEESRRRLNDWVDCKNVIQKRRKRIRFSKIYPSSYPLKVPN